MKKALGLAAILLFVGAASAVAQDKGDIVGTAHDFSGRGWNSTGEICVVCHTPHFALAATDGPLWNHESTTATYTVYSSATLDAGTLPQPGTESKTCLSCHDGTVSLDAFGGQPGTVNIGAQWDVGIDLSDDHPVGFIYNTALATTDGELADPSVKASGLGDDIQADMLFSDQLECASCHDVHGAGGNDMLLLVANTASALCLTCHSGT